MKFNKETNQMEYVPEDYDVMPFNSILDTIEDRQKINKSMVLIADSNNFEDDFTIDQNITLFLQQLNFCRDIGDRKGYALALLRIAVMYYKKGLSYMSFDYAKYSMQVANEIHFIELARNAASFQIGLLLKIGEIEKAKNIAHYMMICNRENRKESHYSSYSIFENEELSIEPNDYNIEQYPTIIEILESISKRESLVSIPPLANEVMNHKHSFDHYFAMKKTKEDSSVYLCPSGELPTHLYRGQSCYYTKCLPAVDRLLDIGTKNDYELFSRLCISELRILLDSHPIIKDILSTNLQSNCGAPLHCGLDYEGLAQHYGVPTTMIDFTNDKWVAAFFAVTDYDNSTDTYSPTKESKYGVIYYYEPIDKLEGVSPLGLHYFNRPGIQKGFAYKSPDKDLNLDKHIKRVYFRHDKKSNDLVYNYFQGGKRLFPEDEFFSIIRRIKDLISAGIVSKEAMNYCKATYYAELKDDDFSSMTKDFSFKPSPIVKFDSKKIEQELEQWQHGGKDSFLEMLESLN